MEEFLPFPFRTTTSLAFLKIENRNTQTGCSCGGKFKQLFYFPSKLWPNICLFPLDLQTNFFLFLPEQLPRSTRFELREYFLLTGGSIQKREMEKKFVFRPLFIPLRIAFEWSSPLMCISRLHFKAVYLSPYLISLVSGTGVWGAETSPFASFLLYSHLLVFSI